MACVLNLFVLSLTLLATITVGSRNFDVLDKKINLIKGMMEVEIGIIKQDLEMVVKNLSRGVVGEVQGKNWDLNTLLIGNTLVENMKNSIQAAEVFYKVIQRGFISEKMALGKSVSSIEQSVADVQSRLEDALADMVDIESVMTKSETLAKFQLLNVEINKNKKDIEAKVNKAKQDAILKSNEDCKTSNIKLNGELNSLQTNFMKIVNDVKKDLAAIVGSVMDKSEILKQFQLLNAEIYRIKNGNEPTVSTVPFDYYEPTDESNEDCAISNSQFASFTPHKYGNSIYFELNGTMSFSQGSQRCRQYGAHLPEVTTSEENAFLESKFGISINRKRNRLFLGATDKLNEGHWVWENTGQAVVGFQDWAAGEPNDAHGTEDCLEIYWNYTVWNGARWNDVSCAAADDRIIVCEFVCKSDMREVLGG